MSDIFWSAVIGVAGALMGSVITGFISYKLSKTQLEARNNEIQLQIKSAESLERRKRLSESRNAHLNSLRGSIGDLVADVVRLNDELQTIGHHLLNKKKYPFISIDKKTDTTELKNLEAKIDEKRKALELQVGYISDEKLSLAIDELLFKASDISFYGSPIFMHELRRWGNKERDDSKDIEEGINKISGASYDLRGFMQKANKRIEELLIGDEAE